MKERVQYLDLLKAIAIFLVVFCHFVLLPGTIAANLLMCACWMAVPTFFMVNGTLLFARPLNCRKHFTKTFSVYLVLVAWKMIYMLLIPLFSNTSALTADFGINSILNYLFLFGELPGIINGHLWFIDALLAVYLVFPVLRIVYDYKDAHCAPVGRRILWFLAAASLLCTNGLHSLEILGKMLQSIGIPFQLSFDAISAFQPFGKYGNMLGFFLLGALLGNPAEAEETESPSKHTRLFMDGPLQRILATVMLFTGVLTLWCVKWFLSGQPEWDGILLAEGYRHIPVILMAVGLFLLFRNVNQFKRPFYSFLHLFASRTLGIFYIHWLFGWMLTNPLAAFLISHGLLTPGGEFGVWANILKNIVLMVPALLVTFIMERIPIIKKLVQG